MGKSTKSTRALEIFGFLGDHRNHPTAGRERIENDDALLRRQVNGMPNMKMNDNPERSAQSSVLRRILFLSDRRFVKFLQKAALLNLLQETEVGNVGGLQHPGFRIVFTIQDRLNRFFHR